LKIQTKPDAAGARRIPSVPRWFALLTLAMALILAESHTAAANPAAEIAAQKAKQLTILTNGTPAEIALACKRLAVYGDKQAVPLLAALLDNPELASWARIALEAIPGPEADAALLKASKKLQGPLLVGAINSIGVRRDSKAVSMLIGKLKDANSEVAAAAAVALGHIGGDKAAGALRKSLKTAPLPLRTAVAEGCVLCAEQFLAAGKAAKAAALYDAVRTAEVPRNKVLAATRGAILARGAAGLPLLLEQLRSDDKGAFGIGLRTARELPGPQVTAALLSELSACPENRKAYLLLAIADRRDPAAQPAIEAAAQQGPLKLRLTAVGILDRQDNAASVPVLLAVAADTDPALKAAAVSALARLSAASVDADIAARLPGASGRTKVALIEVASQRRLAAVLPAIVAAANETDPGARSAAVQALGALGQDKEASDLVLLLQQQPAEKERAEIETALVALSARTGARCVPHLLALEQSTNAALRIIGLHVLASAGGPDALTAVKASLEDREEPVQDEAVRTLSTWPNNWPEDDAAAVALLALAQSGKKNSHQVLGLRGYLLFVQGDKKLSSADKAARVKQALPYIKRPEEQRQAIAILGTAPTVESLDMLLELAEQAAIADEACAALCQVAGEKTKAISAEQRRKALETAAAKSGNADTKKKAQELLKSADAK
jgi:hypothetical protein